MEPEGKNKRRGDIAESSYSKYCREKNQGCLWNRFQGFSAEFSGAKFRGI
jgi:hypothetical protein